MNKTPSERFSPILKIINEADEINDNPNYTAEEKNEHLMEIIRRAKQNLSQLISDLDNEFQEQRKKIGELEEIVQSLYANLDKRKDLMNKDDISIHRYICKEIYKDFWELLDRDSQEFFVTAHYIFDCIKSKNGDFSPVILEYCRVFENELQTKIYIDYVGSLSDKNPPIIDLDSEYDSLKKAAEHNKAKGSFFLSSTDMIKYLAALRNKGLRSGYNCDMRSYLKKRNWDTDSLSDNEFERQSRDYINNYRNEAAHPNLLDEKTANKCADKTKKIVKKFIFCEKKH